MLIGQKHTFLELGTIRRKNAQKGPSKNSPHKKKVVKQYIPKKVIFEANIMYRYRIDLE